MLHLSRTAFHIKLYRDDILLSTATATIWRHQGKLLLVSNWHAFSGRDCYSGRPLNKNGATPNQIVLPLPVSTKQGVLVGFSDDIKIQLTDDCDEALWCQHLSGQNIDLAFIQLPAALATENQLSFPLATNNDSMAIIPGLDAFVLGFPMALNKQGAIPVWKRASIASEPDLPVDGLKIILIDTATREGMSGAPVFLVQYMGQLEIRDDNSVGVNFGGRPERFIGIYSGRFGADDEFAAQLGRVWRQDYLTEMFETPARGTYELK